MPPAIAVRWFRAPASEAQTAVLDRSRRHFENRLLSDRFIAIHQREAFMLQKEGAATLAATGGWGPYIAEGYDFADFPAGSHVLDVGFGGGEEMRAVLRRGCKVVGIEYDDALAARGRAAGLAVCRAAAEHLPFATGSFDGLMCKVVIPYTDEARAIAEIARVLRCGGVGHIAYHGLGYSWRYLLTEPDWKRRLYGARTIVNTHVYRLTGRRLPGFWGDTVYQAPAPLRQYYRRAGLELVEERLSPRFAGSPVFIYHTVRRKDHDIRA